MTTKVHIVNSSDSNPLQHAKVTRTDISRDEQPNKNTEFLLAPSESKAFWIDDHTAITVIEVFEPKPKQ